MYRYQPKDGATDVEIDATHFHFDRYTFEREREQICPH